MESPTNPKPESPDPGPSNELTPSDTSSVIGSNNQEHPETTGQLATPSNNVSTADLIGVPIFMGSDGHAYMEIKDSGNAYALRFGGKAASIVLRAIIAPKIGRQPKTSELRDITNELVAQAEHSGVTRDVYYRCAPFKDGVELDLGDEQHTRMRINRGKVVIIKQGSNTLFRRSSAMRPFVVPAEVGDLKLLDKHINLYDIDRMLLTAWICFTLAQPKTSDTNYVFLALQGGQGTGKSLLCKIIQALIDPSIIGVQTFPHNDKELVIAAQNSHVLFYDNMRSISPSMADKLCIASTGGFLSTRRLYTDDEQHLHRLHVPLVLNGIHPFIDQPDLAQRCLTLHLRPLNEKERRTESDILHEFRADLPMF